MKRLISTLIILTCFQFLHGQVLNVKLKISFDTINCDVYPTLHVTYQNRSDSALYFLRIAPSLCIPNSVVAPVLGNIKSNYSRKRHANLSQENYIVYLRSEVDFLFSWDVIRRSDDGLKVIEEVSVDGDIAEIYNQFSKMETLPNGAAKMDYDISEINVANIKGDLRKKFVFLKSNSECVDTLCLVGFNQVKTNFEFRIWNKKIPNFVYCQSQRLENFRYHDTIAELPVKIDEYNLLSGEIISNSVFFNLSPKE